MHKRPGPLQWIPKGFKTRSWSLTRFTGKSHATNPGSDDAKGEHRPGKLPRELVLHILDVLLQYPDCSPTSYPFIRYHQSITMMLCQLTRVSRFWHQIVQPLLYRHVIIETNRSRHAFYRAVDPISERGRWLGNLVVNLTIKFWYIKPNTKERIVFSHRESEIEQIMRSCTSIHSLKIDYFFGSSTLSSRLEFWVTNKLKLPSTLQSVEIITRGSLSDFGPCGLATPAVYKLIIEASKASVTTLQLTATFNARFCHTLPPLDAISPTFKLRKFRTYSFDNLSRLVLRHSAETLEELSITIQASFLELGTNFPNVVHLEIGYIDPGDSLQTFTRLETLYWTPIYLPESSPFLHALPTSLRYFIFNQYDLLHEIQQIINSNALPNLKKVSYRDMYHWEDGLRTYEEIELDVPAREDHDLRLDSIKR